MIKRIIVEGADQQGKSTLCRELSAELKWLVIHFAKPDANFDFLNGYILPEKTISDRSYLSEIVYSSINDRKPRAQKTLLDNIFKNNGTLMILVDRDLSFKFDAKRHEDYTQEQIRQAMLLYRSEFASTNVTKIAINPSSLSYDIVIDVIIQMCRP